MEEKVEELNKDMTPILLKELGMRFTSDTQKYKARYGLYQCQYCGKEFEVRKQDIKGGNTKSCGCISNRGKNPHGCTTHPLYNIWVHINDRCINSKNKRYADYGGRGIQVCDRWLNIRNFIEDIYPSYQEGLTLDRIDVNGNYEPDNCRWTTKEVQARNTRDKQVNNTSGYRGVDWKNNKWRSRIRVCSKSIFLGYFKTALEAAKAYERYVRINNLEHNFTPALTEDEIEELNIQKEENVKI